MAKILLEMKSITKTFPGVKALDNVNLRVEEGEIHALVGENGAGKSTLMNVLSGIYPYGTYEGDIIYNGEVCKFAKIKDSEEKGIVIIHQELALIPYMTIGENMFLGNERGKKAAIDWSETYGQADEYLRQVGLKESSRTLIKDIGVGKQQLVEIAKALAKHAKLLILDEATSGLDPIVRNEILDIFLEFIQEEDHTVFLSSHITSDIEKISDYILLIHKGKIFLFENKDTLIYDYGLIRCSEEEFAKLESALVLGIQKNRFEVEVLVKKRKELENRYPNLVMDRVSIEDILLYAVKNIDTENSSR